MEEKIGTASYIGKHEKMPKGIDRFEEYPLYNSEGFYIRDKEGNQLVINATDWRMSIESGNLKGSDIQFVNVNYESIVVYTKQGNSHRIEFDELAKILKRYDYRVSKKRTRTYITRIPKVKK